MHLFKMDAIRKNRCQKYCSNLQQIDGRKSTLSEAWISLWNYADIWKVSQVVFKTWLREWAQRKGMRNMCYDVWLLFLPTLHPWGHFGMGIFCFSILYLQKKVNSSRIHISHNITQTEASKIRSRFQEFPNHRNRVSPRRNWKRKGAMQVFSIGSQDLLCFCFISLQKEEEGKSSYRYISEKQ